MIRWLPYRLTPSTNSQSVDAGGDAGGAEAVVDVDNGDVGDATVEHAKERGNPAETGAIAHTRGHSDYRHGDETANDAGQRAFHTGHANDDTGLHQFFAMFEQPVNPCNANVV